MHERPREAVRLAAAVKRAAVAWLVLLAIPAVAGAAPPNIVFVLTDDQALSDQEFMPHTNELIGSAGTRFENAFATEPLCCPVRASLLTGQYSHNHKVLTNSEPLGAIGAFGGRDNTLPVWLDAAGYRTGLVGKYLNGEAVGAPEPGWDRWVSPNGPEGLAPAMYDYDLLVDNQTVHFGSNIEDYKTDVFTRYAQDFINDPSTDPFALFLWDVAPHDANQTVGGRDPRPAVRHEGIFDRQRFPRAPSFNEAVVSDKASWNRRHRMTKARRTKITKHRRDRLESLLAVDEQVATLVQTLQAKGQLDNTIFIFSSDNGYLFGEHRLGAKSRPYEESVRVPLLIRGPGFSPGTVRTDLVALHDLVPTITAAAGATPGRVLDGHNLVGAAPRNELLLECLACTDDGTLPGGWQLLRTNRYAYARYADGQFESYDLKKDPFQMDARPEPPTKRLKTELARISRCAGLTCP